MATQNWWELVPGGGTVPTQPLIGSPIKGNSPGAVSGLPSWTGATSPSTTAAPGGFDWKQAAGFAGVGGGILGALFAPDSPSTTGITDEIQKQAKDLNATGKELTGAGASMLPQILQYLNAITSGDPTALLEATRPERKRVIDQYDTARQTAGRTAQRGGGTASALVKSYDSEAETLGALSASARREGVDKASALTSALLSAGVNAQGAGTAGLTNVLYPILAQSQQDKQGIASTFAGIAEFLGPLLFAV